AKAEWPKPNDKLADRIAEASESMIKDTLEDTSEILKATGLTPKRITYFVAGPWKWQIYQKALNMAVQSQTDQGNFIRDLMSEPELRSIGKPAADFVSKEIRQATQMKVELRKSRVGLDLPEMMIREDVRDLFCGECNDDN